MAPLDRRDMAGDCSGRTLARGVCSAQFACRDSIRGSIAIGDSRRLARCRGTLGSAPGRCQRFAQTLAFPQTYEALLARDVCFAACLACLFTIISPNGCVRPLVMTDKQKRWRPAQPQGLSNLHGPGTSLWRMAFIRSVHGWFPLSTPTHWVKSEPVATGPPP